MLYNNLIVQNDLKEMLEDKNISWDKLKNNAVLITGAQGCWLSISHICLYI